MPNRRVRTFVATTSTPPGAPRGDPTTRSLSAVEVISASLYTWANSLKDTVRREAGESSLYMPAYSPFAQAAAKRAATPGAGDAEECPAPTIAPTTNATDASTISGRARRPRLETDVAVNAGLRCGFPRRRTV